MRSAIRCVPGTASMRVTYVTEPPEMSVDLAHESMRTSAGAAACAAGAAKAARHTSASRLASRTFIVCWNPTRVRRLRR